MFKNKTQQNGNDENYSQTGITVKIHTNHDGVGDHDHDHAEVHRGSLIMAISGHKGKASLRNYIGRPSSEKIGACYDIFSDALSGW